MQSEPTLLTRWLQAEMDKHRFSQLDAAAAIGVGTGTVHNTIRRGHLPKIDTLFRIAGYFDAPREEVLRLAASLPPRDGIGNASPEDDYLVHELVEEFRMIHEGFNLTFRCKSSSWCAWQSGRTRALPGKKKPVLSHGAWLMKSRRNKPTENGEV